MYFSYPGADPQQRAVPGLNNPQDKTFKRRKFFSSGKIYSASDKIPPG